MEAFKASVAPNIKVASPLYVHWQSAVTIAHRLFFHRFGDEVVKCDMDRSWQMLFRSEMEPGCPGHRVARSTFWAGSGHGTVSNTHDSVF